jgi:hypothetical protein
LPAAAVADLEVPLLPESASEGEMRVIRPSGFEDSSSEADFRGLIRDAVGAGARPNSTCQDQNKYFATLAIFFVIIEN